MSERVFAFVEEWVSEHINGDGKAPEDAAALAEQCIRDAEEAGILRSEVDDAFDSLADYLASEVEEAKERREDRSDAEDESDVPA